MCSLCDRCKEGGEEPARVWRRVRQERAAEGVGMGLHRQVMVAIVAPRSCTVTAHNRSYHRLWSAGWIKVGTTVPTVLLGCSDSSFLQSIVFWSGVAVLQVDPKFAQESESGLRSRQSPCVNQRLFSIVNAFRYLLRLTALYSIRVTRAQKVTKVTKVTAVRKTMSAALLCTAVRT